MSHVDEGTLHAYLDGALDALPAAEAERVRRHLADCDACRARLEEERVVREEATSILAGATLDLGDLPSFEEVRARARGSSHAAAPGSRLQRLAWAASVVLALGTGWLLRGGIPRPTAPHEVAEPEAPSTAALRDAVETDAPAVTDAVEADVAAEAGSPLSQVAETPPPSASEARVAGAPAPERETAEKASGAGAAPRPADLWAAARQRQAFVAQPGAPPPVSPTDATPARRLSGAAEEAPRVVSPVANAIPSRDDAFRPTGGSLTVPGLAVVSVSRLEERGLAGAVRVLQLMEDGDTLELVHLPAGTDPSLLPAVGDGRTQVLFPRADGWLAIRGRASADSLSALRGRLEGGA